MTEQQAQQMIAGLARVERLLTQLMQSLADDGDEDSPRPSLDGDPAPRERDQTLSLG
jgi:hypothetical protein